MIVAIAAAALLTVSPPDPTPYELGRASFYTGACSALGWDGDRDRAVAYAEAYDARNPTDDMAGRQAEIRRGIQDSKADFEKITEAFEATGDVPALKASLTARCDALARDIPGLLRRTKDTQAAFDAAIADIVG